MVHKIHRSVTVKLLSEDVLKKFPEKLSKGKSFQIFVEYPDGTVGRFSEEREYKSDILIDLNYIKNISFITSMQGKHLGFRYYVGVVNEGEQEKLDRLLKKTIGIKKNTPELLRGSVEAFTPIDL